MSNRKWSLAEIQEAYELVEGHIWTEFKGESFSWDYVEFEKYLNALPQEPAEGEGGDIKILFEALEVIASNGEGKGMGWTPAQHARIALGKWQFERMTGKK